jgi:hypothetical protein
MKKANTDEAVVSERPNRSRYAERFSKSHPDIDFEDKEARYGAMNEDRDLLDSYEESGRALGETFDKHPWTGSMLMALKENDELDPITWMAENGIDIQQALEDEEYRKTISQKIADYEQKQLEGKKSDEERAANLQTSADALRELGLSDEENLKMWSHVWENIIDPALRGEITADTWRLVQKAQNYDADIENARNEGAMKARNEKIQNSLKKPTDALPPDLASGARASAAPKPKTERSFASSFFEGVE